MKNYTCQYLAKGYDKMPLEIQADTPKAAYKEYMTRVAFQEFEVKVIGSFVRDIFMDHLSSKSMEERRKQIQEKRNQTAIKSLKFLEQKKEDGYFLLETDDKINAQVLFEDIISDSENGPLLKGELEYIKKWVTFKDRELGQTLLAQAEAKKPKDQQGQSPLGNMLMAGMAMSTMRLSHDIGEVSDQVENISEGFGFEE